LLDGHEFLSRFNVAAASVALSEGSVVTRDAKIVAAERVAEEIAKLP
jgi:hypothetical protein